MAYTATIPASDDIPSASQLLLLDNFAAINTVVGVNHVAFNASGEGKHKWVTLPEQGASPTTAVNEVALFSRQSAYTSVAELAIRKEDDGSVVEFTGAAKSTTGWTILPSGILIKWGVSGAVTGLSTFTWPTHATQIPVFGSVYTVNISPYVASGGDVDTAVRLTGITTLSVSFYVSKRTVTGVSAVATNAHIMAIGIPA